MKKLQRVRQKLHTGKYSIDWLNIGACILLLIYNGLDLHIKGLPLNEYCLYFLPYMIYPISQVIFRSNKITAGLYMLVGILTLILDKDIMGMSGLLYIYFSYNEIKTNKYCIVLFILSFLSLSLRFYIINVNGSESIVAIILLIFICLTFYLKIIKDNSRLSKLPEEIKAILKLYCNGYNYEKISLTLSLGVTPGTVRRKITAFMNKNDIKNDAQLGKWLHRNA